MMSVELNDRGFTNAIRAVGIAKFQRAHAVDHGQHAATKSGEARDMRRRARNWDQGVQLDHGFDGSRAQRDARAGDRYDQQKLVHLALPPATDFRAMSRPARSYR